MNHDIVPYVTEGERPSASKWNQLADAAGRTQDITGSYVDATGVAAVQDSNDDSSEIVMFELLEDLGQWSGDTVEAARKTWDPSANDGDGGYTVDCTDIIYVGDFNEVGHVAGDGGNGACIMHPREDGTEVGTIIDLCCPGDETGTCAT